MQSWTAWNASYLWSFALIALTIAIHLTGIGLIVNVLERFRSAVLRSKRYLGSTPTTVGFILAIALGLAVLHGIECLIWAVAFIRLGAILSPAEAALYSVDSMTTRGASGLHLETNWRMMGAVEAGDGMLLFGISTAFLFYVMTRLWKSDAATIYD